MSVPRNTVAFCMPFKGHLHRMLPVVAGLVEAGTPVHFFADRASQGEVERTGARFIDLFANGRTIDSADATSSPLTTRHVAFAGLYGDEIAREAAALSPALVLHDTVAVIGRVVAFHLGVPRVDVRAGHNLDASRMIEIIRREGVFPVKTSDQCWAALRVLHDRHGILDASPFCAFTDSTADLNIYSEPPEFFSPHAVLPPDRTACFGSLWPSNDGGADDGLSPFGPGSAYRTRVYVSFGTVMWRVFESQMVAVLESLVTAMADDPRIVGLVSLGGREVAGRTAGLIRPNVRVEPYVDQLRVLREASVYVTHHGLNSTHEAIYYGVPMVSYPFVWDQPGLAARCQELGLAVPLTTTPRGPVTVADARTALDRVVAENDGLRARLAEARSWELNVMARRPAVIERIRALMG